jgi:hypothetical protein
MSITNEDQANDRTLFTRRQTLSMFIAVEGALLSGLATVFLICYKIVRGASADIRCGLMILCMASQFFTVRKLRQNRRTAQSAKTPSDACDSSLFLSLLAGELLRSVGAAMTLRWVLEEVRLCSAFSKLPS